MIINYSNTQNNEKAKAALCFQKEQHVFSLEDFSRKTQNLLDIDSTDETLTIIDLSANGQMQQFYAPKILAKRLYELGFLDHLYTINLLVSDIIPCKPMLGFATALCEAWRAHQPDANIRVCVPAKTDRCTLIQPPDDPSGQWTLHTVAPYMMTLPHSKDGAFHIYREQMTQRALVNIHDVLSDPDCTILTKKRSVTPIMTNHLPFSLKL